MQVSSVYQGQTSIPHAEIRIVDGETYVGTDNNIWYKNAQQLWPVRLAFFGVVILYREGQTIVDPQNAVLVTRLITDPSIIRAERTSSAMVDGQPTSQITVHIDLAALSAALSKPENRPLLRLLVKTLLDAENDTYATPPILTDAVLAQAGEALKSFSSLTQGADFSVMMQIGNEQKQVQCFCIDLSAQVDSQVFQQHGVKTVGNRVQVDAEFMVTLSKIGQPVAVKPVQSAYDLASAGC